MDKLLDRIREYRTTLWRFEIAKAKGNVYLAPILRRKQKFI